MNRIKIEQLKVSRKGRIILDIHQPIEIKAGEVVGVIGENGAGKSTLINCILDEIPYEGEISRKFSLDEIGVVFQQNEYHDLLTVIELIHMVYGIWKLNESVMERIRQFDLQDSLNKRVGKLSGGERQRLTLFLVLRNPLSVYFFDELTTGLDYQKRSDLLATVHQETKNQCVIMVTHYFEELKNWAKKLLILRGGQVVFFGEIEELFRRNRHFGLFKTSITSGKTLENLNQIFIDHNHLGIVVRDEKERSEVEQMLLRRNMEFNFSYADLYSAYLMEMNRYKVEGK